MNSLGLRLLYLALYAHPDNLCVQAPMQIEDGFAGMHD